MITTDGRFIRFFNACLDTLNIFPAHLLVIGDDNAADPTRLACPKHLLQKTIAGLRFEMLQDMGAVDCIESVVRIGEGLPEIVVNDMGSTPAIDVVPFGRERVSTSCIQIRESVWRFPDIHFCLGAKKAISSKRLLLQRE